MEGYVVQKCRKNDMLYGPTHKSLDAHETLCGREIDSSWWILTNDGSGVVTCKDCLVMQEKTKWAK